jgi:hypothetical protein
MGVRQVMRSPFRWFRPKEPAREEEEFRALLDNIAKPCETARRDADALLDHRDDHRQIRPRIREDMRIKVVMRHGVELVEAERLPGPVDAHDDLVVEESVWQMIEGRARADNIDRRARVPTFEVRVLLSH